MEYHEQGIVIVEYREHIVHLYHVSCPVNDIVVDAILIYEYVYKVDNDVRTHRDGCRGPDAFFVKLDKPQLEKNERYTEFKYVGEIVEEESPAEYFRRGNGGIEDKSGERAYSPKEQEVAQTLVARENYYRQKHGVEGTEMEGKILYGRVPHDEIVDDCRNTREREYAEHYSLRFFASVLECKVETYRDTRAEKKRDYVSNAECTPSHNYFSFYFRAVLRLIPLYYTLYRIHFQ